MKVTFVVILSVVAFVAGSPTRRTSENAPICGQTEPGYEGNCISNDFFYSITKEFINSFKIILFLNMFYVGNLQSY